MENSSRIRSTYGGFGGLISLYSYMSLKWGPIVTTKAVDCAIYSPSTIYNIYTCFIMKRRARQAWRLFSGEDMLLISGTDQEEKPPE